MLTLSTRTPEITYFGQPLGIPLSFHASYLLQSPRQPNENKAAFKARKYAAWIHSDEYKKLALVLGNQNQNEANSGRQRHPLRYRA